MAMSLHFGAVRRNSDFSPNHVGNDMEIIGLTGDVLERQGVRVTWFEEGEKIRSPSVFDLLFSMAQGPHGNRLLLRCGLPAGRIINSPRSVMNCYRVSLVSRLEAAGIPFPRSAIVATEAPPRAALTLPAGRKCWIKRGDVHAMHSEDVTPVYSEAEAAGVLKEFHRRGIRYALVQEHLEGDTAKFYALRGTGFFHWYYLNGTARPSFDQERLRRLAQASAESLGLDIFGGDAIIGADGSITIIDINDWPSFAPVRHEASRQIAELLLRKAQEHALED